MVLQAKAYEEMKNPLSDIIFKFMQEYETKDFLSKEVMQAIGENCAYILQNHLLEDPEDAQLLSFHLEWDKNGIHFKVVPDNLVSGLWLCGIFPDRPDKVDNRGFFRINDKEYKFNEKKGLIIKNIK